MCTKCIIGNVSYEVPAMHPTYGIPAAKGSLNHTLGFTAATATTEAHRLTILNGKALAGVALRLLMDDGFSKKVKLDFEHDRALLQESNAVDQATGCC